MCHNLNVTLIYIMWPNLHIQNVTKVKNSKVWQNTKIQSVTKLQNSKITKLKNSKYDLTQKLKMYKLNMWQSSKCDKIENVTKLKNKNVTKLKMQQFKNWKWQNSKNLN